jgi:hypothetical protein
MPYVDLLYKHARLFLFSLAFKAGVQHGGSDNDRMVADCLGAAVDVCKLVVGELHAGAALQFMPNNIALVSL